MAVKLVNGITIHRDTKMQIVEGQLFWGVWEPDLECWVCQPTLHLAQRYAEERDKQDAGKREGGLGPSPRLP